MSRLNELFQDDCGQLSMSRFLVFLVVVTLLILAGIVAAQQKGIPDVPEGWYWLAALLYGANRMEPTVKGLFGKKAAPAPEAHTLSWDGLTHEQIDEAYKKAYAKAKATQSKEPKP